MRKWNSEQGMSLVEATIILMVLAILTAVIAPSAGDYINEARAVKAKEDVEAIGTGILRVLRDTGSRCLKVDASLACTRANRVDLLVSGAGIADTDVDDAAKEVSGAASAALTGNAAATPYNWAGGDNTNTPAVAERATVDDQLITNATVAYTCGELHRRRRPAHRPRLARCLPDRPGRPRSVGLPLPGEHGVPRRRHRRGAPASAEGNADGGWSYDAIVLSPGSNGMVETAFGASGSSAGGDDVIYVMKGSTR